MEKNRKREKKIEVPTNRIQTQNRKTKGKIRITGRAYIEKYIRHAKPGPPLTYTDHVFGSLTNKYITMYNKW